MSSPLGQIKSNSLRELLLQHREAKGFNPEDWVKSVIEKARMHLEKTRLNAVVLNVSGGIDSAVTFKLFKLLESLHPLTLKKVVPIAQPIHSSEWSLTNVTELVGEDPNFILFDQTKDFDTKVSEFSALGINLDKVATGNLRSSMRTPVVYAVAHAQRTEGLNAFVAGTGNFDEDHYAGFFSKAGDGVVDISLIGTLHKSEVYQVAEYLDVPECIMTTTPSADLGDVDGGDEVALGVTYEFIELYTGLFLPLNKETRELLLKRLDDDGRAEFLESEKKLQEVHMKNKHKFDFPIVIAA